METISINGVEYAPINSFPKEPCQEKLNFHGVVEGNENVAYLKAMLEKFNHKGRCRNKHAITYIVTQARLYSEKSQNHLDPTTEDPTTEDPTTEDPTTEDLPLKGHRIPGQPMKALPIKLPIDELNRLHNQAERLRCYPSALARTLVIRGLDQLDETDGRFTCN